MHTVGIVSVIVVVPIALVTLACWAIIRHDRRRRHAWEASAATLGLALQSGGPARWPVMVGERAGLAVRVDRRSVKLGQDDTQTFVYAEAVFPDPLGLGLNLRSVDWDRRFRSAWTRAPTLDEAFTIRSADPGYVAELLSDATVLQALLESTQGSSLVLLTDEHVRFEVRAPIAPVATLAALLDDAVELARRVSSARSALGSSSLEQVVHEVWTPVAQEFALDVDAGGTRIHGRAHGHAVVVDAVLRGQTRHTVFRVRFDRPLGLGLALQRQHPLHFVNSFLGEQDILVGDEGFDSRFIVKGRPADAVRARLTAEVRAALLSITEHTSVLGVDDRGIAVEVSGLVSDPSALRSSLETVLTVASALACPEQTRAGPYRR